MKPDDVIDLTWTGPTDHTTYLRQQAELCLRASQSCSGDPMAADLEYMAAEFHAMAIRAEFECAPAPVGIGRKASGW